MKKVILSILFLSLASMVFAQSNNPFAGRWIAQYYLIKKYERFPNMQYTEFTKRQEDWRLTDRDGTTAVMDSSTSESNSNQKITYEWSKGSDPNEGTITIHFADKVEKFEWKRQIVQLYTQPQSPGIQMTYILIILVSQGDYPKDEIYLTEGV
jgi:hypothetical protein